MQTSLHCSALNVLWQTKKSHFLARIWTQSAIETLTRCWWAGKTLRNSQKTRQQLLRVYLLGLAQTPDDFGLKCSAPHREWIYVRIGMQIGKHRVVHPLLRRLFYSYQSHGRTGASQSDGWMRFFVCVYLILLDRCAIAAHRRARGINFHLNAAESSGTELWDGNKCEQRDPCLEHFA